MINVNLARNINQQSADILSFPTAKRGRPPIKARRMAMVMLTNPNITQVGAATIAGINQPRMNAWKIVRSAGFKEAYVGYQSHLSQTLPFELAQAHEMYMTAYNKAESSAVMIKAIDSLCRLHGIGQPVLVEREITKAEDLAGLSDTALFEIVDN